MKIIIYDFDGTLTPSPMPQYEIIQKCGYDDSKLMVAIQKTMLETKCDIYEAYIKTMEQIAKENQLECSIESFCVGADNVVYNQGVLDYFQELKDVKHYVVTSGYEEYIKRTKIAPFLEGIFGSTVLFGKELQIIKLMTDQKKVEAIREIEAKENVKTSSIIYIGDGLTDRYAFEYVHQNGGISIFLGEEEINLDCVNYHFPKDFRSDSQLVQFIKSQIHES